MLVKIDGITNKEFSKDNNLFLKFLRENTCSGKVTPEVEVFKGAELSRETFHWVMSTFDTDRDFEKVDQAGWDLKNYLANPVVLWSHDYSIPAIGVAKNVKADMSLERAGYLDHGQGLEGHALDVESALVDIQAEHVASGRQGLEHRAARKSRSA